ncbi:Sec-independent protein translocase subunit TatA [Phytohalomonas tamaricis]|uniref:Sec-independent protein translocase subunit TatA n=1 Tax=Phytohalomonas tamaricis TaxID=2081032 RepID=UPI000D0BC53A|nr:Sec-independent protein translocase subunit TatA [Phytohalomonas tamaricis]
MLGGISIWQLLIVLGIIILIFGTKKIRNLGSDLGGAVKGFKQAIDDDDKKGDNTQARQVGKDESGETFEARAEKRDTVTDKDDTRK